MFGIFLSLLLITLGVAVLLAAGAAVLQGYVYDSPAEGLLWRSAVAALVIGVFAGFWSWLEVRMPGEFDSLFSFDPSTIQHFDQFWSERVGDLGKDEVLYRRGRDERGVVTFTNAAGRQWRRTEGGQMTAIIIEENGERKRFEAERNPDGTFRVTSDQPLRYVEVGGRHRVMMENALGDITTTRYGLLIGNLLLNLVHFLAWFACLWLLLRFQWTHAFGLAIVLWLAFAFLVWPVLQAQIRKSTAPETLGIATVYELIAA